MKALPYRVPPDHAIQSSNWNLVIDGEAAELGDHLPDWDYHTNLSLTRSVSIDMDKVRSTTGLLAGSTLAMSIVWSASGSNIRAPGYRSIVGGVGIQEVDISLNLKGGDLGGVVSLETILTLATSPGSGPSYAPKRAGSLLWSDTYNVRLQGDAPQFPIAIVDFSNTAYPQDAGWYIEIGENMDSATLGSLLLLVNESNEPVARAFGNAGDPDQTDLAIISAAYADVAKSLIEHALCDDEFDLDSEYPDGSIGEMLQSLLQMRFADMPLSELRQRRNNSPRLFSADVQDAVRIFGEMQ